MLKKMLAILLIGFSGITFAADKVKSVVNENIITDEKPNFIVTTNNPQFTIKLKSNPSTGYAWFLREYDAELLIPVKHEFQQGDKKLIGAPGYELWTFRVKPVGFVVPRQTTLRFIYSRPWSNSDSSTQVVFRLSTQGK